VQAPGRFGVTKLLEVFPRYIITNLTPDAIEVAQCLVPATDEEARSHGQRSPPASQQRPDAPDGAGPAHAASGTMAVLADHGPDTALVGVDRLHLPIVGAPVLVLPGDAHRQAIHLFQRGLASLRFRLAGDTDWSTPFDLEALGTTFASLTRHGQPHLYRLESRIDEATFIVALSADPGAPPYRLDNASSVPVHFCQLDEPPGTPELWVTVPPRRAVPFIWNVPLSSARSLAFAVGDAITVLDLTRVGSDIAVPYRMTESANGLAQAPEVTYVQEY